ncbi:MAG: GumC family protein [Candidatus Hydrogenedentes bacterium]|nr:GumC family protein [Candidatus Hydrogenedentota bacterium]
MSGTVIQSSLRDVLSATFRHKTTFGAVFIVVIAAVVLYTYLAQEIYRSDAKVLIRLGRENLSVDPSVSGPTLYPSRDRANEVNSELSILSSREIAEQVVAKIGAAAFLVKPDELADVEPPLPAMANAQQDLRAIRREVRDAEKAGSGLLVALDLASPLTERESAVKFVMENLSVAVEPKTDIIAVSFESPSRALAQIALSTILALYLEEHIRVHAAQASPAFFEEQTEVLHKELLASEEKLRAFREANGISAIDTQKQTMLEHMSELENKLADALAQAEASRARVARVEDALKKRPKTQEISRTTGMTNYAADAMKEKLLQLKLQETDMAARYPETHRPLVDVRNQIKETEAALAKENETHTEVITGIDATYQQLQATLETERVQVAAFESQANALRSSLERQQAELRTLTGRATELTALERDVSIAEKDYEQYRDSLQRAKISTALDVDRVSNVSIVQPATMPMVPVKPKKLLNLALGVFLALFAGLSIVLTLEYFDDSINSPEHIEKWVGVPVLVSVSDKEYKACI